MSKQITFHPKLGEALKYRRSFSLFAQRAWAEVDPAPLVWGWHAEAVCAHLQAVSEGRIQRLIINIPPGHAKSMLVSVLWPAWVWARSPQWRALFASYDLRLVNRDAVRARNLIRSEWYQSLFCGEDAPLRPHWTLKDDMDQKSYYENTCAGFRVGLTVGGAGTGHRGDTLVIDDPMKAQDAHSQLARDEVWRWRRETMSTRFNNAAKASEVIIMQRLHEDDLSGHLLKTGMYQHLSLPSEFETKRRSITYTVDGKEFWRDPRTHDGELLFPTLFSKPELDKLRAQIGTFGYSGQHQQTPVPSEGGMLKREWFKSWYDKGTTLPHFDKVSVFVDASFKGGTHNDRVAIGVVGKHKGTLYLLDLIWRPMAFGETLTAIREAVKRHPRVSGIYIEDKANGPAIIDQLRTTWPPVIPVSPDGGKEARVAAVSPIIEAGNLFLPRDAPWVDDFLAECITFPKGSHDDAVDMIAYALRHTIVADSSGAFRALATL